jgi:arylsulfatase A-like enzyme
MNGGHRPEGLVVLAGPGVRPVGELTASEVVDVLPTLLALTGLPVPTGLDGRPIEAALEEAPRHADDPVGFVAPAPVELDEAATRDLAARLAALGYLEPGP